MEQIYKIYLYYNKRCWIYNHSKDIPKRKNSENFKYIKIDPLALTREYSNDIMKLLREKKRREEKRI